MKDSTENIQDTASQSCQSETPTTLYDGFLTIEFDEQKKNFIIRTAGKNTVEISDDNKSIRLVDANKNELILDNNGITLNSSKDIVLKARGGIKLDATSSVDIKAKSDINLEGLNVKAMAKVGLVAKGNAMAELSASGQTVVKGAMVMIN